jgi:predicted nucleic acid-binding protein
MDTSSVVEFLVGADATAEEIRALVTGQTLAAPHAIDLECASSLRGLVKGRKLPADEAERALDLLAKMNIRRYGHVPLLPRIWQLRDNMWPYDAAYVALAESLQAQLLTIDAKLEKAPGIRCQILRPRGSGGRAEAASAP